MPTLSPSQQEAFDGLLEALEIGNIFVVWTNEGKGKTTMLQELHRQKGGIFLSMKKYIDELRICNPLQMEETLEALLMNALDRNQFIIMDDLSLLYKVMCGCGGFDAYPRPRFVEAVLTSVCTFAVAANKKLVFGNQGNISTPVHNRCYYAGFKKFKVADYEFFGKAFLGDKSKKIDFAQIHRFAPKLNAHQIKSACLWLKEKDVDTEKFLDYLRSQRMASNVDLGEVEAVELRSLKGFDDVIDSLEANIIVPLEQDSLASEFGLKPKRGVLLAGPPGTGKTTIGRALAHRLRSKFFLIDGTFISGSRDFYDQIQQVFEAAKNNAPSIIFVDDSDVIFENKDDFGFYRYLLTMLDGLESESNKRVSIMMTTMDVSSVPPALVRSGRIELWLETRLPDFEARLEILAGHVSTLPEQLQSVDVRELAEQSEGLTGADLRRLVEDGKILYAYDRSKHAEMKELSHYFERAIEIIRGNKEKYATAEKSRSERAMFPSGFDPFSMARRFMADMGTDSDS